MKITMKSFIQTSILSLLLAGLTATAADAKKVLVVTTTLGFRHSSIPTAEKILNKLGNQSHVYTVRIRARRAEFPRIPRSDDQETR